MVIIVPDNVNGLARLIENLESLDSNRLTKSGRSQSTTICLPKFKIESTINLKEHLKKVVHLLSMIKYELLKLKEYVLQLGMNDMFDQKADFSSIAGKNLYVSKVFQKASSSLE